MPATPRTANSSCTTGRGEVAGRKYIPLDTLPAPNVERLTDAQREIVRLLAQGLEPKEIAAARGCAHVTVKNHLWLAKERSGARTTWHLVALVVALEADLKDDKEQG